MTAVQEQILEFWFGQAEDDAQVAHAQAALWWQKSAAVDAEVRSRFQALSMAAGAGELNEWARTPRGRLALILLTDQLPRHIWRDQPAAFQFDRIAQQYCMDGLAYGHDRALRPIERVFFYLPLEHAEDAALQQGSVALFRLLAVEAPAPAMRDFASFLQFARRHQEIIARFGRFPHRNAVLGRESSAAELAFLQEPGSSF